MISIQMRMIVIPCLPIGSAVHLCCTVACTSVRSAGLLSVQCVLCWSGQGLVGPVSSFHCRGWPHPSTCLLPKPPCTLLYPCLRCPFSIGPFWFPFFIQSQCPKRAQIKGGFFNCPPTPPHLKVLSKNIARGTTDPGY